MLTLVLALGMIGLADALTFSTSRSGDLETKAPNETFTVTFSVSLKGNTTIKHSDGELITEPWESSDTPAPPDSGLTGPSTLTDQYYVDSSGYLLNKKDGYRVNSDGAAIDSSGYLLDGNGKRLKHDHDNDTNTPDVDHRADEGKREQVKVPNQFRYHYNSEAININLAGPARIIKIGSRTVDIAPGDLKMYESTHGSYNTAPDHQKLSGSVTLVLEPTGTDGGTVTVKVTDDTATGDFPTNGKSNPITFTLYSVKYQSDLTSENKVTTLVGDSVDYAFDNDVRPLSSYFTFVQDANVPVHYSVDGSGSLSIRKPYTDNPRSPTSVKTASKTLSTSSSAPVHLDMKRGTNKVTAWVSGGASKTMIFIYQGSSPTKYPEIEITGGNIQTGAINARLEEVLTVKVTDGNNRPLSGLTVGFTTTTPSTNTSMFIPVPGTRVWGSGDTLEQTDPTTNLVDNSVDTTTATANKPNANAKIFVQTDRNGVAQTYYQLGGTTGSYQVTATLQGIAANESPLPQKFDATAVSGSRSASLVIVSGDNQSSDKTTNDVPDPLVVRVRRPGGYRISNVIIRFTGLIGALEAAPGTKYVRNEDVAALPSARQGYTPTGVTETDNNAIKGSVSGQEIFVLTNAHGEASVVYNAGQITGAKTVTARINDEEANSQYDFQIRQVVFNIDGSGTTTQPTQPTQPAQPAQPTTITFTVDPTSITGTPGSSQTLKITVPSGLTAQVGNPIVGEFLNAGGNASPNTGSGTFNSSLILPSTAGTYNLVVTAGADRRTIPVTVSTTTTTTTQTGTLRISNLPLSGAIGSQQVATVTATGSDGNPASGVAVSLSVTPGGGVFNPASVRTRADGTATSTFTRGTTAGTDYFVTASATGYTSPQPSRIVITSATPTTGSTPTQTTTTPTQTTTTTPTSTAGTPDLISIEGEATRSGTVNEALDAPLVVEVLDSKGSRVKNARVIFRVRKGQGRLSQRGNGRAIADNTDSNGNARADYTPLSASSTVEASVRGVSETVTFTITTDGASATTTPDTTTPDTTTPAPADVNLIVGAANRPVMYWITGGALYRQATGDATQIAASAKDVVVDTTGGKLYYIEQQTVRTGAIHSANLDGSNATVVQKLTSVPMGLALDTANKKLYLTNGWGKIQRMNVDGTQFETNFITGRTAPMHIAVSGGNVYWTEAGGNIMFASLQDGKNIRKIGAAPLGGIVADAKNVYWTETTSPRSGRIRAANLNGTGLRVLYTVTATVQGLAIDAADGKLYWTNGWGKVQRGLTNGKYQDVVTGLSTSTALAIGRANTATAATPTTPATKTTAANKYDVNGDGTVDVKDSDALIVAVAAGITDAKYDVNGDGKVDINDVIAVTANRNGGAAGAPTLLGMKFSALEVDRLQEQIDLLVATNDRSPAAMRTLVYLQQLIVMARPEKTQLLANYPNPFNPETWIPYELATDTDVTLTIYNAQGVVIRTLQLGQQSAGYYTDRERAAYWDGRNSQGEQVASGVYFYQLETDEMSSLRKMVILK